MVTIYKSLTAVYYAVGAVCIIIGYFYMTVFHGSFAIDLTVLIAVMFLTYFILLKLAKIKFNKEVTTHLHNCRVGIYLEELTKVMGRMRDKDHRSLYACFSAVAYNVLGDYDAVYASCQSIKRESHMPIYHVQMFTYYLSRNELDYAQDAINALSALAEKEKNSADKKIIQDFMGECRRALQVHSGEYDGPLKYYREMLKSTEPHPLLSRVSWSYVYGQILVKTGEKQAAEEPLLFASSRGGDTKFKKGADKLLKEIQ